MNEWWFTVSVSQLQGQQLASHGNRTFYVRPNLTNERIQCRKNGNANLWNCCNFNNWPCLELSTQILTLFYFWKDVQSKWGTRLRHGVTSLVLCLVGVSSTRRDLSFDVFRILGVVLAGAAVGGWATIADSPKGLVCRRGGNRTMFYLADEVEVDVVLTKKCTFLKVIY